MNKEQFRHEVSEHTGNLLLENVHRSVFGIKNLNTGKEHLENGGSIIFYFNHFAKLDPILYGKIINDYLTPFENVAAITSLRQIDSKRGLLSKVQGMLIEDWHEIFNINAIPVIQEKDKEDYGNKENEYYQDVEEFNVRAFKESLRFLRKPGHVLAIAPEGTRSNTNELLEAKEGFEILLKLGGKNVLALPVAGVHSTIRPFNTQTKVFVGEPFSYEEIQLEARNTGKSITELAMRKIAINLPIQNRGPYR